MASYCQLLYHLVWSTHQRQRSFFEENRRELHRYLHGILTAKQCHVYRIGGVEEHVHLLVSIHQSQRLDYLVRDLKASSSKWMHGCGRFPHFDRWQRGGACFTIDWQRKDSLIEYVKNQVEHHKSETFLDEYERLLREAGMEYRAEYEDA